MQSTSTQSCFSVEKAAIGWRHLIAIAYKPQIPNPEVIYESTSEEGSTQIFYRRT